MRYLGLEFWLPLPLLGLAFWIIGGVITDSILNRPQLTDKYLQAESPANKRSKKIVLAIKVEIYQPAGISQVKVQTDNSALKQLTFEFPTTNIRQLEIAISQELGLPIENVRQIIVYEHKS